MSEETDRRKETKEQTVMSGTKQMAPEATRARRLVDQGPRKEHIMLWTIAVILTVLWLLGLMSSYTMGGFIHILLVLALVSVLIRLIQGRRVV